MIAHEVARLDELKAGKGKLVLVSGLQLGIFQVGGEYRAYRNLCPHAGAPVCEGPVTAGILRCPWHGWEFDLGTGAHLLNPACKLESYPVVIERGRLFVLA